MATELLSLPLILLITAGIFGSVGIVVLSQRTRKKTSDRTRQFWVVTMCFTIALLVFVAALYVRHK